MVKEFKVTAVIFRTLLQVFFGLAGFVVIFALNALLARYLTTPIYGDFSVGMNLLKVGTPIVLLLTYSSVIKFVAGYLHEKKHDKMTRYLHWNIRLLIISFSIALILVTALVIVMLVLHVTGVKAMYSYHLAIYMLYLLPLYALVFFLAGLLMARQRFYSASLTQRFLFFFFQLLIVAVLVWLFESLSEPWVLAALFLAFLVTVLLQVLLVIKRFPEAVVSVKEYFKSPQYVKEETSEWRRVTLRIFWGAMLYLVAGTIDLIFLEFLGKNETDVGIYAGVLTVVALLWVVSQCVAAALKPYIGAFTAGFSRQQLQRQYNILNTLLILLIAIVGALILIFPAWWLHFFGEQFITEGRLPLEILTIFLLCGLPLDMVSRILMLGGEEKKAIYINMISLITLIVLLSILIPAYGLVGVAVSSGSAFFLDVFLKAFLVRVIMKIKPLFII